MHSPNRHRPIPPAVCVLAAGALLASTSCGPSAARSASSTAARSAAARVAAPATAHLSLDDPQPGMGGSSLQVRAAYFYDYVTYYHLDSLAAVGIHRALVKLISDTLGTRGTERLRGWMGKGDRAHVEVLPAWNLQNRVRLAALPTPRRYTWGAGTVEPEVGCPLDSVFWRSAFTGRATEILAVDGRIHGMIVDLEIYHGGIHHYDQGPCRCATCLAEYAAAGPDPPAGLEEFQEARLATLLAGLFRELALAEPGIEVGFLDLDYASFVHRAVAAGAARSGLRAVDYTERTYSTAAAGLDAARAALAAIHPGIPIVGGLWLKRYTPAALELAARDLAAKCGGYFLFTTYSLWQDPALLTGPYTLQGTADEYWQALRAANR